MMTKETWWHPKIQQEALKLASECGICQPNNPADYTNVMVRFLQTDTNAIQVITKQ